MENETTLIELIKNMKKKIGPEMYLGVLFRRHVGFLADANIILPHLDRHSIEGLQEQDIGSVKCSVYESWLNYLPLTNDVREARNVHANFSQMLQRKDVHILGPNKENLPKIIMILRAILFRSDELVTEETFGEILEFMDKHDAGF